MALGVLALSLTLGLAGCQVVTDPTSRYESEAHVELTGGGGVPLLLVSSNQWDYVVDELTGEQSIAVVKADTTEVLTPFQKTVALAPTYRILFRVVNPDQAAVADVRMRVRLGDKEVFNETATLRDATLEFSFF
jgi:hypothetical protein